MGNLMARSKPASKGPAPGKAASKEPAPGKASSKGSSPGKAADEEAVRKPPILLLGSTGEIGRHVVSQLLDAGVPLRLGVRSPAASDAHAAKGAEVVHFDFSQPDGWLPVLKGVSAVIIIYPLVSGMVSTMQAFVPAMMEAAVPHVVKMSAAGVPGPDDPNPFDFEAGAEHGMVDAQILSSGLSATIVAPTFFATNAARFQAYTLADHGAFYGMSGDAAVAYVAPADVAAVLVAAAQAPAEHRLKTYTLTGPVALKESETAELLTEQLGKEVKYVDLPEDKYFEANIGAGAPEWLVKNLVALEKVKAAGYASNVTSDIETVLGRPAMPYKDAIAGQKV